MEENNKGLNKNKKQLIIRVVAVFALILVITGVTYAAWRYTFAGTGTSTISTADLSLELLESNDNVINITNALPMDDASGKAQTSYFDFVVTSKTVRDIDIDYTVSIEELTVDSGYTSLTSNQIKLYLTDHNGTAIWTNATNNVQKVSDLTNYQLTTGTHEHDSTHNKVQDKYRLRVWIDSEVDASNWNSNTHYQYKFRLGVTGGEHQEAASTGLYTITSEYLSLGSEVPEGVILRSRVSDAINDWGENPLPIYVRLELNEENEITKSYVEFIINDDLKAQWKSEYCYDDTECETQYDNLVNGTYSLSNLYNNCDNIYECDSGDDVRDIVSNNISVIKTAFNYSVQPDICNETEYSISCGVLGLGADSGHANIDNYGAENSYVSNGHEYPAGCYASGNC